MKLFIEVQRMNKIAETLLPEMKMSIENKNERLEFFDEGYHEDFYYQVTVNLYIKKVKKT